MCGLLEFIVGYLLLHISHIRLWDYNTEILNYGNIGGYICLRSVLFFWFVRSISNEHSITINN